MRNIYLKLFLTLGLLMAANLLSSTPVFAGEIDHNNYIKNSDCGICHRAKTDFAPVTGGGAAFCYACHGRDQAGSNTNVQDGMYANGQGLKGGGFEAATMDTALTGTPSNMPVTSAHSVDGVKARVWGGGKVSEMPDFGTMAAMDCCTCHNPHGNGNYRMLRSIPGGMPDTDRGANVSISNNESIAYVATYDNNTRYRETGYAPENIDRWCAQCHSRYSAGKGAGSICSGDAVFGYRHTTVSLPGGCLACHVAHGTTAKMGLNSRSAAWPDGTPGNGDNNSRLLHSDNRGVCVKCHSSSSLTRN